MRFDITKYEGKYTMRCKTQEDALTFLEFLHGLGRSWCIGTSYLQNSNYEVYGERTGYAFNEGSYGDADLQTRYGYIVINFDDFDWDDDITLSSRDTLRIDNFLSQFVVK